MNSIILVPYNPAWPRLFQEEKERLLKALANEVVVEHIGSTAIPNIAAKPVIDIMIGVSCLKKADEYYIEAMKRIGYSYVPEYESEVPERRYFRKNKEHSQRIHNVHMVEIARDWWLRHLFFRDYLCAHPSVALEYQQLKFDLATKFTDTLDYANAKTEFIQAVEEKGGYKSP